VDLAIAAVTKILCSHFIAENGKWQPVPVDITVSASPFTALVSPLTVCLSPPPSVCHYWENRTSRNPLLARLSEITPSLKNKVLKTRKNILKIRSPVFAYCHKTPHRLFVTFQLRPKQEDSRNEEGRQIKRLPFRQPSPQVA